MKKLLTLLLILGSLVSFNAQENIFSEVRLPYPLSIATGHSSRLLTKA